MYISDVPQEAFDWVAANAPKAASMIDEAHTYLQVGFMQNSRQYTELAYEVLNQLWGQMNGFEGYDDDAERGGGLTCV